MRTRWLVGALVLALAGASAVPAAAQEPSPPTVRAKSAKRVVKARVVSFCWMSDTGGMCADGVYGHTEKALRWRARAALVFGTRPAVDLLEACLMKVEGEGRATPIGACIALARGDDAKWRGRLPKNLRGANSISVFVQSARNDAFYAVSIER